LQDQAGANEIIYFNSKEAADHHPELVLSVPGGPNALPDYTTGIKMNIYPNPSLSVLNVTIPGGGVDHLAIYSLTGQMMLSRHDVGHTVNLNIEHLEESVYLLKADGAFGTCTSKFIIAR
jgi:hypothetical protein